MEGILLIGLSYVPRLQPPRPIEIHLSLYLLDPRIAFTVQTKL
jgi:hypothetical protein